MLLGARTMMEKMEKGVVHETENKTQDEEDSL